MGERICAFSPLTDCRQADGPGGLLKGPHCDGPWRLTDLSSLKPERSAYVRLCMGTPHDPRVGACRSPAACPDDDDVCAKSKVRATLPDHSVCMPSAALRFTQSDPFNYEEREKVDSVLWQACLFLSAGLPGLACMHNRASF